MGPTNPVGRPGTDRWAIERRERRGLPGLPDSESIPDSSSPAGTDCSRAPSGAPGRVLEERRQSILLETSDCSATGCVSSTGRNGKLFGDDPEHRMPGKASRLHRAESTDPVSGVVTSLAAAAKWSSWRRTVPGGSSIRSHAGGGRRAVHHHIRMLLTAWWPDGRWFRPVPWAVPRNRSSDLVRWRASAPGGDLLVQIQRRAGGDERVGVRLLLQAFEDQDELTPADSARAARARVDGQLGGVVAHPSGGHASALGPDGRDMVRHGDRSGRVVHCVGPVVVDGGHRPPQRPTERNPEPEQHLVGDDLLGAPPTW